jgi:putative Mn2+ efflux pump MntP
LDLISIFLIALGLAADCFAVSLSASISNKNHSKVQIAKVSFSFGFFQSLMLVLGWLAGSTIVDFISSFDHWIAFGLLVFVGGRMLWESFREKEDEKPPDISRGVLLLTLSIATSLDSLAVGLAFAFEDINLWIAAPIVGITSLVISAVGFIIGTKVGSIFGKRAEILGGLILIGIGIRILLEHLLG